MNCGTAKIGLDFWMVLRHLLCFVCLKPCPHCHRKRRQTPFSVTVAVFCDSRSFRRQIVAEIGDYSLQCGQALTGNYVD